jgi:hypothetical protein
MEKKFRDLSNFLKSKLGASRVYTRQVDLLSKGTDASFYRLMPQLAVRVESEQEAVFVIKACYSAGLSHYFQGRRHQPERTDHNRLGADGDRRSVFKKQHFGGWESWPPLNVA